MAEAQKNTYSLQDILTERQVLDILKHYSHSYEICDLLKCDLRPATSGLSGFLGDHLRLALYINTEEGAKKIELFIKKIPRNNKPKAQFIAEGKFFFREMKMFKLFEELQGAEGVDPWCTKALLVNENIVVMPDLTAAGYSIRKQLEVFDMQHVSLTTLTVARFHAAFINHQLREKGPKRELQDILQNFDNFFTEANFTDIPWLHVASNLIADFVQTFSTKYQDKIEFLKQSLLNIFLRACNDFKYYPGTLNVIIHRDLWVNNIMFKYNNRDQPINALLIDFQCIRYGPPTFDLAIFLYLTTSRSFRERHESEILLQYFSTLTDHLSLEVKKELKGLNYDFDEFQKWYEVSRLTGAVVAASIFPYVLMEPRMAQQVFDDSATFEVVTNVDRSQPVLKFAYDCSQYRDRILEVAEELIERYILSS